MRKRNRQWQLRRYSNLEKHESVYVCVRERERDTDKAMRLSSTNKRPQYIETTR